MQVFLSWSGERSKALADILQEYLPLIIQSIKPWFSPDDIDKGSRWLSELSGQLQKQCVAIVCITPESVNSPWLLFEAGALSKALEASWVCPVLLDIEPSEIKGPLAQFQATRITKEDIRKLLGTLNKRLDNPLADQQIDTLYDVLWEGIEKKIKAIPKHKEIHPVPSRSPNDLLSEILERVRGLERRLADTEAKRVFSEEQKGYIPKAIIKLLRDENAHSQESSARLAKFSTLRDEIVKQIMDSQEQLKSVEDGDTKLRSILEKNIETNKQKLASYEAEIGRWTAKLSRSQHVFG